MSLRDFMLREWNYGALRSAVWAANLVANLRPKALLDVGCGDGYQLSRRLWHKPDLYCGVEANPKHASYAKAMFDMQISSFDLNVPWTPYTDEMFNVIHCGYVIEHLHNTRLFAAECLRTLKPGGTVIVTTENLCSLLNLGAMALGYTPFTLANCCGWMVGNPLSLHTDWNAPHHVPMTDPAFTGVTGHVRALSVPQAKEIFERVGFKEVQCHSIALLPLPNWIGSKLEKLMPRRGHFLMLKAVKPKAINQPRS